MHWRLLEENSVLPDVVFGGAIDEICPFMRTDDPHGAVAELAAGGTTVVGRLGAAGAIAHDGDRSYSADGLTWTLATVDPSTGNSINSFLFAFGRWFAFTGLGKIWESTDNGDNWTEIEDLTSAVGLQQAILVRGRIVIGAGVVGLAVARALV